ncbi:MAG: response regulator [Prevotellaceae bacterium]|jgi:signal transduction histidine kinase/ligand-binding sensor domain-containing protein/DNA-binding response OmpR family regulator|nr:response regulator [Prevotellaceae bacterium]
MKHGLRFSLLVFSLFYFSLAGEQPLYAYSLKHFTSQNGLSNSAILSLCQDQKGLLWIGSCDGLNVYDGLNFQEYRQEKQQYNFSGNLIEGILEETDEVLWVQTNYGLDRLDKQTKHVQTYKDFKGKTWLLKDHIGNIFVIKDDNHLYYYSSESNGFEPLEMKGLVFEDILTVGIDGRHVVWVFMKEGKTLNCKINFDEAGHPALQTVDYFRHDNKLLWCFFEEDMVYFVDESYVLYTYDTETKTTYYIYDLQTEIQKRGDISTIIRQDDNYFIGFKSSGLIRLQHNPNQKVRYTIHEINIKSGIFCLIKDRFQDIVWVGTDGQGVYMYYADTYVINTTLNESLPYHMNNPVRALYLDIENTLWIGSKGDGIIRLFNYDIFRNQSSGSEQLSVNNSQLKDNSVYAFEKSRKDILWIGTEKGLNYYSYRDKTIKSIDLTLNGKIIRYVHAICEFNDSTLWIATVGDGIVKVHLSGDRNVPVLTREKLFVFDDAKLSSNYFFTAYKESDSIIWFGNRGYGAYKINNFSEEVEIVTFDQHHSNQTVNDIFSILKNDGAYWFGTGYGPARIHNGQKQIFDQTSGFPNRAVHGILQDQQHNLWISTNHGLVKFNITQNTFQTYGQHHDMPVAEFSDGAHFKHEPTGVLFFGGINGFVTVCASGIPEQTYRPLISFNGLSVFGQSQNIRDFLDTATNTLQLNYRENFFSVSFTAIDYLHGDDYTYMYQIDELNTGWINNGHTNTVTFTNISPGTYTLQVKYRNNIIGEDSHAQSLTIHILPPWYQTGWAYAIYTLLILIVILFIIYFSIKWYKMKKDNLIEKLTRQQKEEIYEAKLRFFTNITHELCTPLTLIYGPCEKILAAETNPQTKKYAGLIKHNAERLNSLILELIEFRRLETDNKKPDIKKLPVSEIIATIADSFAELAESKHIDYRVGIDNDISWFSDAGCLQIIVTNLLSNAFKYTPEAGRISIDLHLKSEKLHIEVSNTGQGIKKENIDKIFDRYTILDNHDSNSNSRISPRSGLGLAICNSMVRLLNGEITVSSEPGESTIFTVILSILNVEDISETHQSDFGVTPSSVLPDLFSEAEDIMLPPFDKNKKTIMIIDDDPSMLWFITEIFIEKYNVIPLSDSKEVAESLKQYMPDLIISDIMMPDIDGITLTRRIKSDKYFSHIPLILLSAKNESEEQVKGINSGAETYITKPFNVAYLETVVERLIQRKEDLRTYYSSALSAFSMNEGKPIHQEDKTFLEQFLHTIETNITDPELTVEKLSSLFNMSTRQFYRQLKRVTDKLPADVIRDYRLDLAERLLVTTKLSVDEIIYKAGFANRGNFFKVFAQKFNTTPKKYREEKLKIVE